MSYFKCSVMNLFFHVYCYAKNFRAVIIQAYLLDHPEFVANTTSANVGIQSTLRQSQRCLQDAVSRRLPPTSNRQLWDGPKDVGSLEG